MNNKLFIFLDLEQTVIDSWETMNFLFNRASMIKNAIDLMGELAPDKEIVLGIMSWAVWNHNDLESFNEELRKPLEDFFERPINITWTMEDWFAASVHSGTRVNSNIADFFDSFTKEDVLFKMRNHDMFKEQALVLFDDAVEDMFLIKGKFSANTINVSKFEL